MTSDRNIKPIPLLLATKYYLYNEFIIWNLRILVSHEHKVSATITVSLSSFNSLFAVSMSVATTIMEAGRRICSNICGSASPYL